MTTQPQLARPSRALNVALWTVQVLLTLAFLASGVLKLISPEAQMHTMMAWTNSLPTGLIRSIGVAEVLGALGLILPAATRIQPRLTPLAAAGLVVVMLLASAFHLSRGEGAMLPVNLLLLLLAAFVAWGRSRPAPIPPRA